MVGNFVCTLRKYSQFCATAENLVCLRVLLTKLHHDFYLLHILEFHGKTVLTI